MFNSAIIFVLSVAFLCTDANISMHNPFYCFSQDPIVPQFEMFSSITSYETIRGRNSVDPNVSSCTPSKFWMVARHGTTLWNLSDLQNIFQHNERLHRDILSNYEAGRTSLCASDIEYIRNWRFDPNITLEMNEALVEAGWNEIQGLAQRYQAAFPTLLPSTYVRSDYLFRFTNTVRTLASMRAFADGLFGFNGYQQVGFEDVPDDSDLLLRPHDFCPLLNEARLRTTEPQGFIEGPEYQQMLSQVSAKLGFHGAQQLRQNEVDVLYTLCKHEQIFEMRAHSTFCGAFSIANHQVLEYYQDLVYYYRYGYGFPSFRTLYENIYCFAMQDLLTFIQSDNPNDQKARVYSTHTASLHMLVVTLGILEDEVPLTRHNFAQQTFRNWRSSNHASMGTNLVIVKFDCDGEDNDILFLHNERPLQLPGCQANGLCKQSFLLERFSRFMNANCEEVFCRNS